jgi:hypothetical protein
LIKFLKSNFLGEQLNSPSVALLAQDVVVEGVAAVALQSITRISLWWNFWARISNSGICLLVKSYEYVK